MDEDKALRRAAEREVLSARLDAAFEGLRAAWSRHQVGLIVVRSEVAASASVDDASVHLVHSEHDHRIRSAVRPGDAVARLDDFRVAILCERLDGMDDAVVIALRIEEALQDPLAPTHGHLTRVALELTLVGSDDADVAELLDDIGSSRDRSPAQPAARWSVFDDSLRDRARHRQRLEEDLRVASDGDGLLLRYQPEKDMATGQITAVEALVRWQRNGELVGPDDFIPLAEETGLIVPIGSWVLHEACSQLARWRSDGLADGVSMAVNVSPAQLLHPAFVDEVGAALDRNGLGPGDLVLEITENVLLVDVDAAVRHIDRLRALGVRIAIDDFGTGHASLTYLYRLPIDAVKLDRSFVEGLGVDDRLTSIVTAVVALIHAIGAESIAEGVSTVEQYEMLRSLGCGLAQGAHIGPPVSGDELVGLLS